MLLLVGAAAAARRVLARAAVIVAIPAGLSASTSLSVSRAARSVTVVAATVRGLCEEAAGHLLRELLQVEQAVELGHERHEGGHLLLQLSVESILSRNERLADGAAVPEQRRVTGHLVAVHLKGGTQTVDGTQSRGRGRRWGGEG